MKNLVIDTILNEIRIFNEKTKNWEVQKFEELNLQKYSNFATRIEEIQQTINEHNEYEVLAIVDVFGRTFNIELFYNTTDCKGVEVFDIETKECWFKSMNNELLFNCVSKHWDYSDLVMEEINVPDGHGTETATDGYVYVLEQGDYDIYDIYVLAKK